MEEPKKNILILGGGFGGLACARRLNTLCRSNPEPFKNYRILLIDQHDYQLFTPPLYEIATTPEATANALELKTIVTFPFSYALWGTQVTFLQGKVTEISFEEKSLLLKDGERVNFEYLVIAPGTETNYFNIPGLKEYAYPLKNLYDALRIRDAILSLFSPFGRSPEGRQNPEPTFRFLIVGGGPSGVELAGELSGWIRHLEKKSREKCKCEITLLEAGKDILSGFEEKIAKIAKKRLTTFGVKIITNDALKEIKDHEALLSSDKTLAFDILVWAGGVKAPDILAALPHKIEKKGRVEVSSEMLCVLTDPRLGLGGKTFTIGDAACFYDPKTGHPIPGVARTAIEQGKVAAENILADLKQMPQKAYQPMDYPYIIPIGGKWAIARFGPIVISGFFGWILKGLVDLYYIASILPLGIALSIWLKGLKIFIQND